MTRFVLFTTCVLTCRLVGLPASADDPPKKLTSEERKELEVRWNELRATGRKQLAAGKADEAEKSLLRALELCRRLYGKDEFPNGHPNLGMSLTFLAVVFSNHEKYKEAEAFAR